MDRRVELIDGEVTETESSDARVEARYLESRERAFGTNKIVEIQSRDVLRPRSFATNLDAEEVTPIDTNIKPIKIQSLSHIHSKMALKIRERRTQSLQGKKAA